MKNSLVLLLILSFQTINAQIVKIGIWSRFEKEVISEKSYRDPFSQTALTAEFIRPDQTKIRISGYFTGTKVWKIRFMPDQIGRWTYTARFSDDRDKKISGAFECVQSDIPGLISYDSGNPAWFGFKGGKHILVRSFHAGDRFFAENWPEPDRKKFLDWIVENDYNTLSLASHILNRNDEKRGKGWKTPDLWNSVKQQPNPDEYSKMERILDELAARKILVFPFAGFFGQKANWPTDSLHQSIYIKYTIARLGAYWNLMYNVAGPEPLYKNVSQFTKNQVDKLGKMISAQNTQGHLLTVHNEKNHNPFIKASWASFQCLQGPTTLNTDSVYNGLIARRNPDQPLFAQEVLWFGNTYQQVYSDDQLRKNAITIIMAGAALNFADNDGTSSTGFSGTMNLNERHQDKHEIIKKVWDFFESIPYYELTPGIKMTTNGYCLAKDGQIYLTYLPKGGELTVNTLPGEYLGLWIKASDTKNRINFGTTDGQWLTAPSEEDWFLYLQKNEKK